jgi:hypothetical protein
LVNDKYSSNTENANIKGCGNSNATAIPIIPTTIIAIFASKIDNKNLRKQITPYKEKA